MFCSRHVQTLLQRAAWLQVFASAKHQPTILDSFNQLISVVMDTFSSSSFSLQYIKLTRCQKMTIVFFIGPILNEQSCKVLSYLTNTSHFL